MRLLLEVVALMNMQPDGMSVASFDQVITLTHMSWVSRCTLPLLYLVE